MEVTPQRRRAFIDQAISLLDKFDARLQTAGAALSRIQAAVPRVKDATPWWADLLGKLAIGAAICAALGLAIYLGAGALARPVFSLIGGLIPAPTRARAKLDAEATALAESDPVTALELHQRSVTVSRTQSPAYDAAFRRAKSASSSLAPSLAPSSGT